MRPWDPARLVEARIREAQQRGELDHLPGAELRIAAAAPAEQARLLAAARARALRLSIVLERAGRNLLAQVAAGLGGER